MSYEGYEQCICKNGHYYEHDAYTKAACHVCGSEAAWSNSVDNTNYPQEGVILPNVLNRFLISPPKTEMCNLGHTHLVQEAVYRVPTYEETYRYRYYPSFYK